MDIGKIKERLKLKVEKIGSWMVKAWIVSLYIVVTNQQGVIWNGVEILAQVRLMA